MAEPAREDLAALRASVEGLQGTVRNLWIAVGVLGVALLCVVALSLRPSPQAPPGSADVEVASLRLVDATGAVRAQLGVEGTGDAVLRLADPSGASRLALRVGEEHATVELTDAPGRALARLSAVDGLTSLHLAHGRGGETAQLSAGKGNLSLNLADLDGESTAHLRSDETGTELNLSRLGEQEVPRVALLSAGTPEAETGPRLAMTREAHGAELTIAGEQGAPRLLLDGAQMLPP